MEARKQKVKKENKPMVVPLTSDYYHKIDRILGNLGKIPNWEIRKTKNLDPPNLDPSILLTDHHFVSFSPQISALQ